MTKVISEYQDKGAMLLVSSKSESKTEGDVKYVKSMKAQNQNKGDKSRGKPQGPKFQDKCWRCDTPRHMGKDCRKSKSHICKKCGFTGHFEIKCKTSKTVNRHKIMDMDEVEAVVETTEEVGVAAVRAEACDLRKTRRPWRILCILRL